jgi:hypothetical protein
LDDLVLQGCNRERTLSSVRLRDEPTPGGLRPIRSSVDLVVQILDPAIKISLVVLPS